MERDKTVWPGAAWQPWGLWSQLQQQAEAPLRERRMAALLQHAQTHSPYYRAHWGGHRPSVADWQQLPPVNKHGLMARFDEWVTDPGLRLRDIQAFVADPQRIGQDFLGRYAVWTSSGTTGEPGVFVQDAQALAQYALLTATRRDARDPWSNLWQAAGWWQARSTLIAAADGHYAGITFWRRQCRLNPWLAAHSQVLSVTAPQAQRVADLQAFQPDFLVSYPSVLTELAQLQAQGELHIAPRLMWAGGERLAPSTRSYIESVFGAHVINDYGASECMTIGFECAQGRVHVNDDWVLLEPIDAQGRPVLPGQPSHSVLLTNLANHVQPIIRYDLGDSITVHTEPCPCGNARMSVQVQGRCDDSLRLRDPRGRWVHLSPMALSTALEEGSDLHCFQMRQTAADAIELRLDLSHEAEPRRKQRLALSVLRQFLSEQGLPQVHLHFDPALPAVEPHSGKLRQVIAQAPG
jgi:phenylacetate-CoA ligase